MYILNKKIHKNRRNYYIQIYFPLFLYYYITRLYKISYNEIGNEGSWSLHSASETILCVKLLYEDNENIVPQTLTKLYCNNYERARDTWNILVVNWVFNVKQPQEWSSRISSNILSSILLRNDQRTKFSCARVRRNFFAIHNPPFALVADGLKNI